MVAATPSQGSADVGTWVQIPTLIAPAVPAVPTVAVNLPLSALAAQYRYWPVKKLPTVCEVGTLNFGKARTTGVLPEPEGVMEDENWTAPEEQEAVWELRRSGAGQAPIQRVDDEAEGGGRGILDRHDGTGEIASGR